MRGHRVGRSADEDEEEGDSGHRARPITHQRPTTPTSARTTGCWRRCTSSTRPIPARSTRRGPRTSRPTARPAAMVGRRRPLRAERLRRRPRTPSVRPAGQDRGRPRRHRRRRPAQADPRCGEEARAAHQRRRPDLVEAQSRPWNGRLRSRIAGPPRPVPAAAYPPTRPTRRTGPSVSLEEPVKTVLRGAPARTAKNMDISLSVPTATSVRSLPVKLLIDQRVVINNHLRRARGGKVSYTHLIGYAMVQALKTHPEMNNGYDVVDGKPTMVVPAHVNLGLAIDMPKPDGTRQLLVPSIKSCETLDFAQFWSAYEQMVKKARAGQLTVEDFAGTTITLTNPGTIGTNHSVPAADAGPGRDHRRRLDGVPAGVPGLRPRQAVPDERLQGDDADLDLRPPGDPGRPVRAVPAAAARPAARRGRLLRRRVLRAADPVRADPLGDRTSAATTRTRSPSRPGSWR